jgi:hypothetical protein
MTMLWFPVQQDSWWSSISFRQLVFINIEFHEHKKLILNQVNRASHFVKIIVACPHHLPKLPESTQCNVNRQYPIRAHCSIVTVVIPHDLAWMNFCL